SLALGWGRIGQVVAVRPIGQVVPDSYGFGMLRKDDRPLLLDHVARSAVQYFLEREGANIERIEIIIDTEQLVWAKLRRFNNGRRLERRRQRTLLQPGWHSNR